VTATSGYNLPLGEQRHMCVNNLPKVEREAPGPGIEPAPATSRLQVRRLNHYARHTEREHSTLIRSACNSPIAYDMALQKFVSAA